MGKRIISLQLEDTARALARVPLFEGTSQEELLDIAAGGHLLVFTDGEVIVPEGEDGLGFYVILSGAARVDQGGTDVAQLATGDFFGEISLIEGLPRTATVVSSGETTCFGILRSLFRPMLVRKPRLALRILEEEGRRFPREDEEAERPV